MSQKNDTPVLILSLLITLGLIGGGVWWLVNRFGGGLGNGSGSVTLDGGNANSPTALQDRFSAGEKLLVSEGASAEKKRGVEAIAARNYSQAITDFTAALQSNRNDPESLIYLNNASIGTQPTVTIAVSVPATKASNYALEILRGVAQAQSEVNQAGGVNGKLLRVLVINDDNDPKVCTEVANALVQDASVLGVVGHFGSDATLAAGAVYQQAGLAMVSPTSTSVQLSSLGNAVYRTVPSDRFTAAALSRYMLNTLQKQNAMLFFNSESSYSKSLKDEFTTALTSDGGTVAAEYDLAAPGFSATDALAQATAQGTQVLVLAANAATLDPALQVIAANRQRLSVLGGDSLFNPKVLQAGTAADMVVAVPWVLLSNPDAPFAQASRKLWGGDVNWRTAMAYDAAMVLVEGMRGGDSRQAVVQTLAAPGFTFNGATGTVKFLPSGDRNQAMQLVKVEAGGRSGYGYDFVPVQ